MLLRVNQTSSLPIMINRLKKTQSKPQQQTPKVSMLKRFGGKVKRAFSKKQSLTKAPIEPYVQNVQVQRTALPESAAKETEQLSTENGPLNAPALVGTGEESHKSDDALQRLTAITLPNLAVPAPSLVIQDDPTESLLQDSVDSTPSTPKQTTELSGGISSHSSSTPKSTTERSKIVRSLSSPQLPSPPTTGASSRTIFITARDSEASSPSSLVKYDQILDNRRGLSKKCLEARYEYIKGEEEERKNADWVALLKWMNAGHQAELIKLQKEHTAEIEDLKQQRSEERRRLEVRNRELRATRREMKELKETLEGLTRDQEEIKPASDPQSLTESHEESPDEEEGGVVLANKYIASAEEAQILEHCESKPIKNKGKGKDPAWETAEERRERQRVQKQQLLDDSTPDFAGPSTGADAVQPAFFGQVQASTAKRAKSGSYANNGGLSTEVQDLQAHNRGLKASLAFTREVIAQLSSEAEAGKEEMARLRAGNHFAQLEVGHCHAANACYRAALEDENPARTAHLDGLLKQKDAAYAELETRAAECARLLCEEKKKSATDNIYNLGKMQGLEKELAHRLNMIQALTEGRDLLKQQNDEIIRMFEAKIYPDDATKALLADYDTIRKDNTILAKVVHERDCYVLDAEKQVCDLKAEAVVQEHAMDRERLTHRQTEQSLNGLTVINHQLTARLEIAEQTRGEEQEAFQAQLQAKSDEVNHISTHGANPVLMQRLEAQHTHIAALNHEIARLNAMGNQWRMRALEQQDEWCPMWQFGEINDWDAEEMRGRLWGAEQQVRVLRGVLGRLRSEGVEVGGMDIGHDGSRWLMDRAEAEGVREAFE